MMSDSLTIAMVSTPPTWYGGEEEFYLLAQGLRQRGHGVHLLVRRGGAMAERTKREGFAVAEFSGNGKSPQAVWRIRQHLRRIHPHVLHYNDPHALTAAGFASLGLGIPARIMSRRVDFPLHSTWHYRRFCDRVCCVSRAIARVCRECGLPESLLRVAHEGVDPNRVRSGDRMRGRKSLALGDADLLLLTVAKLTDHKGHRFLLEAFPAVLQRHPTAVLALAGGGELRDELEQQAARLGIASRIRFLGYRNDVPDLIQAADLIVQPSHMEGLCTTLIDMMLASQTIVTTTAGGIPDLTGSDDPNVEPVAWVVPPRDSGALAAAILSALAQPDERRLRAARACQRAERLFTNDCMVETMLAAYRDVLQR
jgi:glycosyltransferase involved in cell wall biosynthesis